MVFLKAAVYCSNYLHMDCQEVISGQVFERQFLNNWNDGFLEKLVPQSGEKTQANPNKKGEVVLDLSLSNTVTSFKSNYSFTMK